MQKIDMTHIRAMPTKSNPNKHVVSIRKRGVDDVWQECENLDKAIAFRDKVADKIASKAKAARASKRAERAANPSKFDFEGLDVRDIVEKFATKLAKDLANAPDADSRRSARRAWSAWASHVPTALKHIGQVSVAGLTYSWAADYRDRLRGATTKQGKPFSYDTINKHYKLISCAVRKQALSLDLPMPAMPFSTAVLFPKGWERKRKRLCKADEEVAIRAAAAKLDHPSREQWGHLISLAIDTGARLQEMALAQWEEVDFDRRVWTIPSLHTKADAERSVPLSKRATAALLELRARAPKGEPRVFHLFGNPDWTSDTFRSGIAKPSGVQGLRLHDLRHTAITKMLTRPDGPRLAQVMAFVGHKGPEMTERYSHLDAANFVDQMG